MEINLRELFTKSLNELPPWVNSYNVIYRILNLMTNDSYIGQAKSFYERFAPGTGFTHYYSYVDCCKRKYNSTYLYNALRKYKSRNFSVQIIENNVNNLDEREIYWIKYYHTYYLDPEYNGGYNMTSGGDNTDAMHTEDAKDHRRSTNLTCYGAVQGALALTSSKEKSIERRSEIYGTPTGMFFTPKNWQSRLDRGNGDSAYMLHTKEVIEKRRKTCTELYGDPCGQLHAPEVIAKSSKSMRITKLFTEITKRLNSIDSDNLSDYMNTYSTYQKAELALERIKEMIIELRSDQRWNNRMEIIFNTLIPDQD